MLPCKDVAVRGIEYHLLEETTFHCTVLFVTFIESSRSEISLLISITCIDVAHADET